MLINNSQDGVNRKERKVEEISYETSYCLITSWHVIKHKTAIKRRNKKVYKVKMISKNTHKMGKQINFLIICFMIGFCISIVSAITLYSGETIEVELEKPYDYYSIVGNSTPINITIIQHGNNATITPSVYAQEDSYEIIFFDKEKEIITIYKSSGGGGGSSRRTVYKDKEVIEYVDRDVPGETTEVEVPGETIEVEKIIKRAPWFVWVIVAILLTAIVGLILFKKQEKVERRLETYEQEDSNTSNVSFEY